MRALLLVLALVLLSVPAFARSVQIGSGTVALGNSVAKLIKLAGAPERIRHFPGMPGFELYEYASNERTVTFTVHGGKITGIGVMTSPK